MSVQSSLPFEETAARVKVSSPLRALPVREGHWDELRDASGQLRPTWQRFFDLAGEEGVTAFDRAVETIARQVRDNDISYNVYADNGEPRPWSLDLLPFLIDETEWAVIERAVRQRAVLLNSVVGDIYGTQTLLRDGLLPPALVFGHPGYLRSVKGFVPPGGRYLQLVAVDLARAPSGEWVVMAHRTEAPSGLGYALENRLIVSGVFADAFRALHVERLAPFYSRLIAALVQGGRATMSGEGAERGSPHIALLTPGPFSETFFEHAFLARYLGVTLVEGKDLTVRDDKLFLKTFAGLERVHVLLRRLDDAFCDPVELRADSHIGVPGLLQVMRAGNVMVSNVPGSGFVESPALHGFLPAISHALLGERLELASVPTWWCGEAAACESALKGRKEAFVLPTWPGVEVDGRSPRGFGDGLQPLAKWKTRIESMPDAYTIQELFPGSQAPRYEEGTIVGRPSVLRVYAIANIDGGWSVMPGGFTRLGAERQPSVSMQYGSSSVDTWVLSSKPASSFSLLPTPMTPADLVTKHRTVSSRAAENLFWAGRYSERAENNVRLLRVILSSLESNDSEAMLDTMVDLAWQSGLLPAGTPVRGHTAQTLERVLVANLGENGPAASVGQNLASQTRASSEIRGRLSTDHWRTILAARNDFRDAIAALQPAPGVERYDRGLLTRTLENLATQLLGISGAQGDRMTRDEAWRLVFAGRHIERVSTMALYLRTVAEHRQIATPGGFDLLLQLFDSTLTYRSLYPGRFEVPALIDLLVVEPTNPRGLYGVYRRLCKKLVEISIAAGGERHGHFGGATDLLESLRGLEVLCIADSAGTYDALIAACDELGERVSDAAHEISARYFSHANTQALQVSS
ncbi:hypothetical protein ASG35_03975 [Burkholderia sp. Leaf177]|uniref:circularly permuted type 2 ATP-grasp protein n=1 Tax=Burkholderia sp. Leaf177 TaxID=1736287 RepID=UPI0006F8B717|nr:circularly permuted type 2 ATP-grasp protein [Burkholderia sp. Leaf177]KQR81490.1 hypothetical protein ASG35_03975 [Burkholderia sp. Leaf177]